MSDQPSFLAGLKRRNVLRATTFCAASAWLSAANCATIRE